MQFCGWDIGGAHLKFARLDERGVCHDVRQLACPLWLGLERLDEALERIFDRLPGGEVRHAVTMTGELCDAFSDRADGVGGIAERFTRFADPRSTSVYAQARCWVTPAQASAAAREVASANWHATARFIATRRADALMVDIGSTTTDIINIVDGRVAARGSDDFGRLKHRELVYRGVVRTPVMAVVDALPVGDDEVPVAAEYFATVADAYRLLVELPADADLHPTADNRDKGKAASARRLLRMVGLDFDGTTAGAERIAARVAEAQYAAWSKAFRTVAARAAGSSSKAPVIGIGPGRFVARRLAAEEHFEYLDFELLLDADPALDPLRISSCAPAVAVAALLQQRSGAA